MSLLDLFFDQTSLSEEGASAEYSVDNEPLRQTPAPRKLSSLLQNLGPDPSKNLLALLDFGPAFLGYRSLTYSNHSGDEIKQEPEQLQIQLKEHGKLLTLQGAPQETDPENLSIYTALLAQQERRLNDFKRMNSLEEYTKTLFEACPDGIVVTDDYGIIINANRAMTAITRKPKESLINSRVNQLADGKGRAQAFKALRRLKEHHRARFDCRIRVGAKRTIPVSISFRDFNFQGKPLILATVRDLSDLEDEVTRCTNYEESLSRSINNASDGFIRYDQFGRITEANPYVEELTGHSPIRLVGRPIDDLLDVSALRSFRRGIAQLQETGYASFSCAIAHADGSTKTVQTTLMQLELEGERYCRMMLQDRSNLCTDLS